VRSIFPNPARGHSFRAAFVGTSVRVGRAPPEPSLGMAEPAAGEVMRSSVESSRAVAVSQFHRGVVTTDALKVGVAADRDNRHQSHSAFLAVRDLTHGNPPELFIHNPFRALAERASHLSSFDCTPAAARRRERIHLPSLVVGPISLARSN
jgi:hypothetical protein